MADSETAESATTVAALTCTTVPQEIIENLITILKEEAPEVVVILTLADKYERRFGVQLNPETYGYRSVFDMVQSMEPTIEAYHHDHLQLWVARYKEVAASESGVGVDEFRDHENNNGNGYRQQDEVSLPPIAIIVVPDVDSDADVITLSSTDRMKMPQPAPSVASTAFSSISTSSMRRNVLPPPPPSVDWAKGSRSILGKRQASHVSGDGKRIDLSDRTSRTSMDESTPKQDVEKLEIDRNCLKYIPFDRDLDALTHDDLVLGRRIDVQKPVTSVDTTFCARATLERLMEIKYDIRTVTGDKYKSVQDRMMDFGNGPIFHHAEAYILANIDALTGWSITRPTTKDGKLLVGNTDILYVADIQGGPGGFAEYIMTKCQWESKVYGFTFSDEVYEYQLSPSGHYPVESFERWAGLDGTKGDGSIYRPEHLERFSLHIRRVTGWQGLHVCIGGGKEVTPGLDEDRKELRAKEMLLAECTIALKCLREGGTFLLRVYDLFTPYTVGLVYLMYRVFEQVAIVSPETTRPGSSERFLVCKQYRGWKSCHQIATYLANCHSTVHASHENQHPHDEQLDILELVPTAILKHSERFYDYIYDSNETIGSKQLDYTTKICEAITDGKDNSLIHERVATVKRKCSEQWNCPRQLRQEPKYQSLTVEAFASIILRPYSENILKRVERQGEVLLTYPAMERDLINPKEWSFVCVGRDRGFYTSMGGDKVYRFVSGEWKQMTVDRMDLAESTLVYGDIVDEIKHVDGKQYVVTAFHIIDGLILGKTNIRYLPYNERMLMCAKFGKSMDKTGRDDFTHVRAKKTMEATRLEAALTVVHKQEVKGRGDRKKGHLAPVNIEEDGTAWFANTGYVFLKTSKGGSDPTDFLATMQNRLYWRLDDTMDRNPKGIAIPRPRVQKLLQETPVCSSALVRHINSCSKNKKCK